MSCRSGISGKKCLKMDDFDHPSLRDADEKKVIKDLIASHLKFR
ncbi:hypothetical protein [Methanobacterium ferruginis]|jgi:hypothetical protein|nr:hypothetical protein [Methanobacterium ferruginis]BDZ68116.1 hypothetical protein GCM10025860_15640 [Methanobacterium ferruginis]